MDPGRTRSVQVERMGHGAEERPEEQVLVEEPLEVHLGSELVATTMRTPGNDFELAAGFLWAEGLLSAPPRSVAYGPAHSAAAAEYNAVTVEPAVSQPQPAGGADAGPRSPRARLGITSSSCGVCGTREVERLLQRLEALTGPPDRTGHLDRLLARVTEAGVRTAGLQELFALTGGSHAAAAVCGDGILAVREDIGRHNALDKVLGAMLMEGSLPAAPGVRTPGPEERPWIWVSGRASFEVVQKAWSGGFGALVAVGAVSSLAVEVSRRANMTLVGFSRVSRATVYNVAAAPEGPS